MGAPAPKPANFDDLTAAWNNPQAFAMERARYYAALRAEGILQPDQDRTEPTRGRG